MTISKIKLSCALSAIFLSTTALIGCANVHKQESTGQFIDSSVITTKVKTQLLADKVVSGLPITVKTYKNTVQLSGFVNNVTQKDRAVQIAKNVQGVEYVQDSMMIKSR
jgi:osmotically-inducible protein OsmY